MVKAWLRDDPDVGYADRLTQQDPVRVVLDDDCCSAAPAGPDLWEPPEGGGNQVFYGVTIRDRRKTGYDEESGNAIYQWVTVAEGQAIQYDERYEFDAAAGATVIKSSMTVRYEGTETIRETAVVVRSDDVQFRIVGVKQQSGTLTLDLRAIDSEPVSEVNW